MKNNDSYEYNAINLYRNNESGILSTISKEKDNYPFGSFVTYISGRDRTIYLYLSDIAEHTKNLKHQPKSCLTISRESNDKDQQNSERLTLVGDLKSVAMKDVSFCKERFHTFFPESIRYADFHGFNFYELDIHHVRWIGGFGKISWINSKKWKKLEPDWKDSENSIIKHMNDDHHDSIVNALFHQHNIKDNEAIMLYLTLDGYYIKSVQGIFFIQFNTVCNNNNEYKQELIRLANEKHHDHTTD